MKTNLNKADPLDPHLEDIIERIFRGRDEAEFQTLCAKYARLWLNLDGESIGRDEFMAEFQAILEHASECVSERESEDRKNDYPATEDWEHS